MTHHDKMHVMNGALQGLQAPVHQLTQSTEVIATVYNITTEACQPHACDKKTHGTPGKTVENHL